VVPPIQPVAAVVVPALLGGAPTPDLVTVLAAVNALTTADAVVDAVAQLAPSPASQVAPLLTFHGNRQFQNLWLSRLDCGALGRRDEQATRERDEERDVCANDDRRVGWWMNGFGYFADQESKQAFVGYDASIGGGMVGYDAPVGPDTHMGFGLGYSRTAIRADAYESRTDTDNYQATAYVGHAPGPWFINAAVSYGINEHSGSRQILFPGVDREANADFSGYSYSGFARAGFQLFAGGVRITPFASIEAMRVHVRGYRETGAGDVSLNVQARKYDFVESALGVELARQFDFASGSIVPEVHARWLHKLSNPELSQTASFAAAGSPSFTTPGFSNADDSYNLGGALTLLSGGSDRQTWSLGAGYDYYGTGDGYSAHQGTLKLTGRF